MRGKRTSGRTAGSWAATDKSGGTVFNTGTNEDGVTDKD
jgi:hypothetical protein